MGIEELSEALALAKAAISGLKEVLPLIRGKQDRGRIEKALEQAEKAFEIAEGKAAKELGYQLCLCTFPPQIMLLKPNKKGDRQWKCPKCGHEPESQVQSFRRNLSDDLGF